MYHFMLDVNGDHIIKGLYGNETTHTYTCSEIRSYGKLLHVHVHAHTCNSTYNNV